MEQEADAKSVGLQYDPHRDVSDMETLEVVYPPADLRW